MKNKEGQKKYILSKYTTYIKGAFGSKDKESMELIFKHLDQSLETRDKCIEIFIDLVTIDSHHKIFYELGLMIKAKFFTEDSWKTCTKIYQETARTAVTHGAYNNIKQLHALGFNLNIKDYSGNNLMHTATTYIDSLSMVEALLEIIPDSLTEKNLAGYTPLILSAIHEQPDVFATLKNARQDTQEFKYRPTVKKYAKGIVISHKTKPSVLLGNALWFEGMATYTKAILADIEDKESEDLLLTSAKYLCLFLSVSDVTKKLFNMQSELDLMKSILEREFDVTQKKSLLAKAVRLAKELNQFTTDNNSDINFEKNAVNNLLSICAFSEKDTTDLFEFLEQELNERGMHANLISLYTNLYTYGVSQDSPKALEYIKKAMKLVDLPNIADEIKHAFYNILHHVSTIFPDDPEIVAKLKQQVLGDDPTLEPSHHTDTTHSDASGEVTVPTDG
jgi:hypothetical protein